MKNELLINLTNSVLGKGYPTSRGNIAYKCPFCNHPKNKLEVNFTLNSKGLNPWNCWVCHTKGKKLINLFKSIKVDSKKIKELKELVNIKSDYDINYKSKPNEYLELPKEFTTLYPKPTSFLGQKAYNYLIKRGLTYNEILKYNIGYCVGGEYDGYIIIPSYDRNLKLNYYIARNFLKNGNQKYKNPPISRDVVPFESFINWNLPLILCEGAFDMFSIKRNTIPLLGTNLQSKLLQQLVKNKIKNIYLALDSDQFKQILNLSQYLINEGKNVYLIELPKKDPNELGFRNFTKLAQTSKKLNPFSLLEKQINQI